jgi:hypothetical protein
VSTAVQHRIWHFSEARGTELLVLLALATYADTEGHARPSLQGLARKARLHVDAAVDILGRLERKRELTTSGGHVGGSGTVYVIAAATRKAMPERSDEA